MTGLEEKHSVISKEDMQSAMDFVEDFSHELEKYPHRIAASKDETACARAIRNRLHDETDAKTRLEAFDASPLLGRGSFLLIGIWYAICYVMYFVSFAGGRVTGAMLTLLSLVMFLGGLMQEDLIEVVKAAAGGAQLSIGLCIDDNGLIAINLFPMNAPYGMLGYMQATWVDSDNLLMAVINVVSLRNWMAIFGAIGAVLIIAAGVCRDMGEKTRKRTEDSRDRILRAKAAEENGVGVGKPDEQEPPLETA